MALATWAFYEYKKSEKEFDKMKAKTFVQIFSTLVVLALAAWAFYEYKKSEKEQQKSSFLNHVDLEELIAFRIVNGERVLNLVHEDQKWLLKEPVQDLASFTEISSWLNELKNLSTQKIQTEGSVNWQDYHLDKAPRVEMDLSSGESVSFSVSRESSFDEKYFIRKGEELFVGDSYFHSEVNDKDFESFRSKKLLPPLGHAVKIQFEGAQNFTLTWKDHKWSLLEPAKSFPLDSSRLDGFWTDLSSMNSLTVKDVLSAYSLKKYRLHKAQLKISLHYPGEDEKYVIKLSPFQEEKAFVSLSHRNFIFEISKEEAEKLILPQDDIRDHAFPFKYSPFMVVQIEKKSKKDNFSIKKLEEGWQSLNKKDRPVDSEKVEDILDKIKNLRAEKYQLDSAKHNLRSFEMKDSSGQSIFELKEVLRSENYSWLKTSLWDELVAVPKNSVEEIFNIDIFAPASTSTEQKEKKSSD